MDEADELLSSGFRSSIYDIFQYFDDNNEKYNEKYKNNIM